MKILLTGANGLVGSTINADVNVKGKSDLDLTNFQDTLNLFQETKPTHVIHTAAKVREAVETIAKVMGFEGKIIFDDSRPDGQFRKPTCNIRLMDFLPEYKFTPFEEGIKQTVDWFVENYETCRK
jgi:nucleoside-diphosphate-sugar epimerase